MLQQLVKVNAIDTHGDNKRGQSSTVDLNFDNISHMPIATMVNVQKKHACFHVKHGLKILYIQSTYSNYTML